MTEIMAQPNFQILADAFTTVGQQCALFSNIPAVEQGQALLDIITEMRNEMRQLRNDIRTEITGLRTEVTGLRTEITAFRSEMTSRLDAE